MEKKNLIITGILTKSLALRINRFGRFFTNGTINKACLTESAASNTTSENFLNGSVVNYFNEWNYKIIGIETIVHILYKPFMNYGRSVTLRLLALDCSVIIVRNVIK